MSIGTIVSRATGVLRLAAMTAALGIAETRLTDTYNLANTAPNILYELVLGGVITSVFVPLFVEVLEKEDRERSQEIFSAVLTVSLLGLTALAIVGVLAAPWIAHFYASRLSGGVVEAQQRVITLWLRLFIPQVILYGLYFVSAAILNAHKRFGPPMYTPILNNLVLIAVFIFFAASYGAVTLKRATSAQLMLIGLGTTASVAPMGLALLPYVRRLIRYRFTLSLRHPSVRKLARLSGFVVGFVAVNQIGYVVIQWLANKQQGGYSSYISAFTFFLLPIGLFVWSITTALLPALSSHAVNARWPDFRRQLSAGVRATVFLMLPCTVGYLILAEPVVRVLLQHGVMTSDSTALVASVLRWFVLALLPFSVFQLSVRAFYALQNTKTPFLSNCALIALSTAINIPMFTLFGVQGLAAGQAIAYTFGIVLQARGLSTRGAGVEWRTVAASTARSAVAALGMGIALWLAWHYAGPDTDASYFWQVGGLLTAALGGAALYIGLAYILRVPELGYLKEMFARRTGSRRVETPVGD